MANAVVRERDDATTGVVLAAPTTPLRTHYSSAAATRRLSGPRLARRLPVVREELPVVPAPLPSFDIVGTVDVRRGPIVGIVEGGRGQLLVTTPGSDSVAVLDPARGAVTGVIGDIYEPFAATGAAGRVYVTAVSASNDEIAVIDVATRALSGVYPVSGSVRSLVASPDGAQVYLTRTEEHGADVAVFDTVTTEFSNIEIGDAGSVSDAIAISPDGARLYVGVADNFANDLIVVDTASSRIVNVIAMDAPIRGIAVHPGGTAVYVLSSDPVRGGAVHVVDARTGEVKATTAIGGLPTALSISRGGGRLYVSDVDQVTVVCTASAEVVGALDIGAEPSAIIESADGRALYIADFDGRIAVFAIAASNATPVAEVLPAAV